MRERNRKREEIQVPDMLKNYYTNDLSNTIKRHWKKTITDGIATTNNRFLRPEDIELWRENMNAHYIPSLFENFSKLTLNDYSNTTSKENRIIVGEELSVMLPNDSLVKAFFPVLLSGYVTRRWSMPKVYLYLTAENYKNPPLLQWIKKLWVPIPWKEDFKSLQYKNCKLSNASRTLPVFAKIVQFLFFLVNTRSFCNVGLSLYVFEQLTGYISLLDYNARYFCVCVEKEYAKRLKDRDVSKKIPPEIITEKTKCDDQIIKYIETMISNLQESPCFSYPKSNEEAKVNSYYATFFVLLKFQLIPELLSTEDEEECAQLHTGIEYDDILMYKRLHSDEDSITSLMGLDERIMLQFEYLKDMYSNLLEEEFLGKGKKKKVENFENEVENLKHLIAQVDFDPTKIQWDKKQKMSDYLRKFDELLDKYS